MKSTLAILLAFVFTAVLGHAAETGRQYYELRVYTTKSEAQQKRVVDYWKNAAVPAYNRMGVQPIGVFTESQDSPTNRIYVLIPFDSLEAFGASAPKLARDDAYQKAAADFMGAPKADPPYARFESSLLVAMRGMPRLAVPSSAAENKPWLFELRTYLSHTEAKGDRKVEMFDDGEIAIMQEVGLSPVFFAQTIAGTQMPSLVYMVSGENLDEHRKHWRGFGPHPLWKKLAADPKYKDTVSGISNVFLKRTAASQI